LILAVCALFICGCGRKDIENDPLGPSSFAPMEDLDLWCDYFYLIDTDTGQILMDRGSTDRMFPASMTKVMTSILAIEKIPDPENVEIEFTSEMMEGLVEASANRAGFVVGDKPTALDHIYGDLLPSGADCSRALAFYISGSEEAFVRLMNQKAEQLGMKDTHFVNTSGLHDDDHYTTCRDMMKLYLYCMENPLFMEIITTENHTSVPVAHFPRGLGMVNFVLMYINQEHPQFSHNYSIPGFIGGKSGYTIEGQYTLVSNAEVNGMNLALVNAHGYKEAHYPASIEDASVIYNWYRTHFARRTPVKKGDVWGVLPVRNTMNTEVEIVVDDSVTLDLPSDDENVHLYAVLPDALSAPLAEGEKAGTLEIYAYDQKMGEVSLLVKESREFSMMGAFNTLLEDLSNGRVWIFSVVLLGILLLLVCQVLYRVLRPVKKKKPAKKRTVKKKQTEEAKKEKERKSESHPASSEPRKEEEKEVEGGDTIRFRP